MAEGFLGRWSQRKQAVREGKPVKDAVEHAAPPVPSAAPVMAKAPLAQTEPQRQQPAADDRNTAPSAPATESTPPPPPPSMQDVAALNADSDFKPFVARAVAPEVRNAAMKKLFADPHFNVMDGLDIYIDDYSIPDPLPASMLRKMVSAQFLKLFDEEEPAQATSDPGAPAQASPAVAQADTAEPSASDGSETPDTPDTPDAPGPLGTGAPDQQITEANHSNSAATTDPDKTDPPV